MGTLPKGVSDGIKAVDDKFSIACRLQKSSASGILGGTMEKSCGRVRNTAQMLLREFLDAHSADPRAALSFK